MNWTKSFQQMNSILLGVITLFVLACNVENKITGRIGSDIDANPILSAKPEILKDGDNFAFSPTGGKPPYDYQLLSGGGSLSGVTYTAATVPGVATIRISDSIGRTLDVEMRNLGQPRLWLKPESLSALNDNDLIPQWDDSSGAGFNAVEGTPANQPTYKTNILNGHPAIRFDGSDKLQTSLTPATGATPRTLIAVVANGVPGEVKQTMVEFGSYGSFRRVYGLHFIQHRTNTNGSASMGNDFYGNGLNKNYPTTQMPTADPLVVTSRFDGTSDQFLSNGLLRGAKDSVALDTSAAVSLRLGSSVDDTDFYQGDIFEVLAFDFHLDDAALQGINCYLGDKYNISIYQKECGQLSFFSSEWTMKALSTQAPEISGGKAPYSLSVLTGGGSLSGTDYTAPGAAGTVQLRVTDANGDTADATITVTDFVRPKMWLKADAITGHSDDDPVTYWQDESGFYNTAHQLVGARKPLYKTNVLNSQPVLRFDGADDYFATPLFPAEGANPRTHVAVIVNGTTHLPANNREVILGYGDSLNHMMQDGLYFKANFPNSAGVTGITGGFNGTNNSSWHSLSTGVPPTANPHIVFSSYDGTTYKVRVDGELKQQRDLTLNSSKISYLNIADSFANNGLHYQGDIAEILVFDQAVSGTDLDALECYLGNKYGISLKSQACGPLLMAPGSVTTSTSITLGASGGNPPYTYSIQSGGGSITGDQFTAPGVTGTTSIRVTDSLSASLDVDYEIIGIARPDFWLKADTLTGYVDNDPVKLWPDSSGNENHAIQYGDTHIPLYKTGIINGLPALRFDGDDMMGTAFMGSEGSDGRTAVAVIINGTGTAETRNQVMSYGWNNVCGNSFGLAFKSSGASNNMGVEYNCLEHESSEAQTAAGRLLIAIYDGTDQTFYANTNLRGSETLGINTIQKYTLKIGADFAGNRYYLQGDVAEIMFYNRALTGPERTQLESHLMTKYGLTP